MLSALSPQAIEERRRGLGASLAALRADVRSPIGRVRPRPSGGATNVGTLQPLGDMRGDIVPQMAVVERISALGQRFERAVQYRPPQLTRRRRNSILAFALICLLLVCVGQLSSPGAGSTQSAHAQPQSYPAAGIPGALVSGLSTQSTAWPGAPPSLAFEGNVPFKRILGITSAGDDVAQLQLRLRELGYLSVAENNGYYGESTLRAVSQFQADQRLQVTGVADRPTVEALNGCGEGCIQQNRMGENAQ